jgi:tRNA A37 N6-isopentenylltransferase MiaA
MWGVPISCRPEPYRFLTRLRRALELFAKRGLVPSSWHSATSGADNSELTIDIQMRGMAEELADFLAARLRQMADIEAVLTSQKR